MTKAKACVRCATGSTLTIEDEWGDLATSCMSCGMVTYPQTPKHEFKAITGWEFPDEEIVTRTCLGCRSFAPLWGPANAGIRLARYDTPSRRQRVGRRAMTYDEH